MGFFLDRESKSITPDRVKGKQTIPHERAQKRKTTTVAPFEGTKRRKTAMIPKPSKVLQSSPINGIGAASQLNPLKSSVAKVVVKTIDLSKVKNKARKSSRDLSLERKSTISRRNQPSRGAKTESLSLNQVYLETSALAAARKEITDILIKKMDSKLAKDIKSAPFLQNGGGGENRISRTGRSRRSLTNVGSPKSGSSSLPDSINDSIPDSERFDSKKKPLNSDIASVVLKAPLRLPVTVTASIPEPWVTMPYQGAYVDFSRRCRIANPRKSLCKLMEECRKQKNTLKLPEDDGEF